MTKHDINTSEDKKENEVDIDYCTTTAHPEMARNSEDDFPCDDNRTGR